jgi:hypothetical protein
MSYFVRELSDNTVTLVTESGRTIGVFVDLDDAANSLVEEVLGSLDARSCIDELSAFTAMQDNELDLIA